MSKKASKTITEDVIIEIISRVPIKGLFRFACVSKSWRAFISTDPHFARLQVQRSTDRPLVFIQREVENNPPQSIYLIDLEDRTIPPKEVYNPFADPTNHPRSILGASCHGLVVQVQNLRISVSNPTTKTHIMVPPCPAGDANVSFCGLGYDHLHNSYKLVEKVEGHTELEVYDINRGTWRSVPFGIWWESNFRDIFMLEEAAEGGHLHHELDNCDKGCVEDCVYWCLEDEYVEGSSELRGLVCFLLAEEEFHVVKPPQLGAFKFCLNMTVFDQHLGLVFRDQSDTRRQFWSVKLGSLDGNRQWQWTKFLEMPDPSDLFPRRYIKEDVVQLRLVCFSASRNKVLFYLMDDGMLFWYDLQEDEFTRLKSPVNSRCLAVGTCVPTLAGNGLFAARNIPAAHV